MSRAYSPMKFYIQLGHNDQTISVELVNSDITDGVILSPRHLSNERLIEIAKIIKTKNKDLMFDPQLYNPQYEHSEGYPNLGDKTRSRIADYKFNKRVINEYLEYQRELNVSTFIIPNILIEQLSEDWFRYNFEAIEYFNQWKAENGITQQCLLTVAISHSLLSNVESRNKLLDRITSLNIDGFYLVCEPPEYKVLQGEKEFLLGQMDFVFRLKQNRYYLVNGFTSYHNLLFSPLGLDAFCSGGFKNRRAFDKTEWDKVSDDSIRRSSVKFASISLLGFIIFPDEIDFLHNLSLLRAVDKTKYSEILFDGEIPSSKAAVWKIKMSFLHYLSTCNKLTKLCSKSNRSDRIKTVNLLIDNAISYHKVIIDSGVKFRSEHQGKHLEGWKTAFNEYINEVDEELMFEYM